ncbi:MAG: TolC family protein [Nannocystaceae bacterium]
MFLTLTALGVASLLSADLAAPDRRTDPVALTFDMQPGDRLDAYGPRPVRVPQLSREQIVRFALENPLVQAADEHVREMEAELLRARFAWVPVVKASAVLSPGAYITCEDITVQTTGEAVDLQWCGSPNADISQLKGYLSDLKHAGIAVRLSAEFVVPLYTFGKLKAVRELGEIGVAMARLEREQTRQETILKVHEAIAGLLLSRESIRILDEAWDVVAGERVKIERDLGAADDFSADPDDLNADRDPDDLVQLDVGEIELATRMREARKLESLALASLWALAGRAAPPGFDVAERQLSADAIAGGLKQVGYYRKLAAKRRPEGRMLGGLVRARKAQEKLARANFLPDLGLAVRVGYKAASSAERPEPNLPALYYSGNWSSSDAAAALALSWTLDFHNDTFALKKARALHRRALHQRDAALELLGIEVERAYRDLVEARDRTMFMAMARDKSWQLVVSQQQKATVGGGDFGDLRRALTGWAEYEFKHFEAIQRQNIALAKLSRAVGLPLVAP